MAQTWERLLFAHWPVPAAQLRRVVPAQIPVDTHDGSAWIAVTPFRITGLRARGLPGLPGLSTFPELNVRTYVTAGDRPGILFFSLDAASRAAVWAARALYRLPYAAARMAVAREGDHVRYRLARPAAEVRLSEVIKVLDAGEVEGHCKTYPGVLDTCVHTGDCGIRSVIVNVHEVVERALSGITLAQLVGSEQKVDTTLHQIRGLGPAPAAERA